MNEGKPQEGISIVATNRQAGFNYVILDRFEAGLALKGSEVKSIREGRANLRDSYVRFQKNEAYVVNLHISPYSHISFDAPEAARMRKLLMKRAEIARVAGTVTRKGFTCVPLKLYFKRGWAKLEIAICQGKKTYDRRESIKKKMDQREINRSIKQAKKGAN